MIETTELFSLLSLFSKNLEAHCSHEVLTVLYGSQSEKKRQHSELPDCSKRVKVAEIVLWSLSLCHVIWSLESGVWG